jgi:MFS transporter, DHA1 family, multidrug resistance protein
MSTATISELKGRTVPAGIKIGGLTFVLAALSWLGPFSIDTYLPSLPSISKSLNAPAAQVQQTMTAFLFFFAIMTLWHGAISDAFGRRRLTLIALSTFSIASVGCALATNVHMLMFFRGLQGATAGAGMIVGRAVVRDVFEGASAQRLMSNVATIFTIAPVMAPVLGGWFQVWFGWRSIFVFLVFLSSFLVLSCYRYLPETLAREGRQRLEFVFLARSYLKVLTQPAFLTACASMAFTSVGFFIYILSAPVFLMKHLHLRETEFLWLFGPMAAAMMLGAWISGHFAGKISGNRTIFLGYAIMAVGAVGNVALNMIFPPSLPWAIVPIFVYVVGMCTAMPSLTLISLDLFPAQRGFAASCQSFFSLAINTLVSGFVAFFWSTTLTLALTELVMLVAAVAAILLYAKAMKKHKL